MPKPSKKPFNKKPEDRLKTFQKSSKKPFKPLQKSNDAIPIQLEDEVPDFPRGPTLHLFFVYIFFLSDYAFT